MCGSQLHYVRAHINYGSLQLTSELVANNILNVAKSLSLWDWRLTKLSELANKSRILN